MSQYSFSHPDSIGVYYFSSILVLLDGFELLQEIVFLKRLFFWSVFFSQDRVFFFLGLSFS